MAAYNAGHGRVDTWGGKSLTVADIRFPETVDYTSDVIDKRAEYAKGVQRRAGALTARLIGPPGGRRSMGREAFSSPLKGERGGRRRWVGWHPGVGFCLG